MKRYLAAAILILSLAGLMYIQFRLLVSAVRLEKQRFDLRTEAALQAFRDTLNQPNILSDALIARLQMVNAPPQTASLLRDTLQTVLAAEMKKRGVTAKVEFAVTSKNFTEVFFTSSGFKAEEFDFGRYSAPLGDRMIGAVHLEQVLHLDIQNLFGYLVTELDYLVVPSVIFLLAILGCLALLINILRKEEKLNQIKNDFINNLTHELNTPAFSISLSAKLAKESLEKGDPAKAAQFLQLIEKENEKLKTHIGKVLELASLESPRYYLKKEPADLHELVREAVAGFEPTIREREGHLKVSLQATRHEAEVDKTHFQNVLRNLLDNALKYTPGQPVIEVSTKDDGRYFLLSVKDNGAGIAPAQQQLVFDKFYRVPGGNTHAVKGFGLGLSYVKQIVEAHSGKAEVKSRQGETVFLVRWPA